MRITARLAALFTLLALTLLTAPAMAATPTVPDEVAAPTEPPEPPEPPTPTVDTADDFTIEEPCWELDVCEPPPPPPCEPQDCLAPNPETDDPSEFPIPYRIDAGAGGAADSHPPAWAVLAALLAALIGGTAYEIRGRR